MNGRTVLIIDSKTEQGLVLEAERIDLRPQDVIVIRGQKGDPILTDDDARDFEIRDLESQLDQCHELVDALQRFLRRAATATSMTEISDALAEYAGVISLPEQASPKRGIRLPSVRSAWNTLRRRPTGQA